MYKKVFILAIILALMAISVTAANITELHKQTWETDTTDYNINQIIIPGTNVTLISTANGALNAEPRIWDFNSSYHYVTERTSTTFHSALRDNEIALINTSHAWLCTRDTSVNLDCTIISWNSSYEAITTSTSVQLLSYGNQPFILPIENNVSMVAYQDGASDGWVQMAEFDDSETISWIPGTSLEVDPSYGSQFEGVLNSHGNLSFWVGRGNGNYAWLYIVDWDPITYVPSLVLAHQITSGTVTAYENPSIIRYNDTQIITMFRNGTLGMDIYSITCAKDYSSCTNLQSLNLASGTIGYSSMINMSKNNYIVSYADFTNDILYYDYIIFDPVTSTLSQDEQNSHSITDFERDLDLTKIDDTHAFLSYKQTSTEDGVTLALEFTPPTAAPTIPLNGSGTENDPYQINKCEHFYNLSYDPAAYYALMNNLNCENISAVYNIGQDFSGVLDGRNLTISNYFMNKSDMGNNEKCGFLRTINGATIKNLIINNFTVSCYNPSSGGFFSTISLFSAEVLNNVTYNTVAIKNSKIYAQGFVSLFGSNPLGYTPILTDTYATNTNITVRDPIKLINAEDIAVYANDISTLSIINNSWSNTFFSATSGVDGGCFTGRDRGSMNYNYYNNESCDPSIHSEYGATGITYSQILDADDPIWADYSLDKWYFKDFYEPIFRFEYEKIPRPFIYSPNASIKSTIPSLDVIFQVFDNDHNTSSCDLYFDGSVNQTNSTTDVSTNTTLTVTGIADGLHSYYVRCTDSVGNFLSSSVFTIEVDTIAPVITLTYPLSDNSSIANYSFTLDANATDVNLDTYKFTLRYPNDTILYTDINSPTNDFFNLTGSPRGIYTVQIFANDTFGQFDNIDAQFFVDDTIPPNCFGFGDSGVFYNNFYNWDVSCYDERKFFSMNVSCIGSQNFTFFKDNINQTIYTFSNSTRITEETTCFWEYCDGHTAKKLKEKWKVKKDNNKIEFQLSKGKNKLSTKQNSKFSAKVLEDKITFDLNFTESGDTKTVKDSKNNKVNTEMYTLYYETSGHSYYYSDSYYKGWIVDYKTRTWFDLNDDLNDIIVNVFPYNSTTWEIQIIPSSPRLNYKFKSTGELNCVSGSQFINVTGYPSTTALEINVCPESLTSMLGLWLVVLIGFFFVLIGLKYYGLGAVGSFILLVSSWILTGCFQIVGLILALGSILLLVFFVFKRD